MWPIKLLVISIAACISIGLAGEGDGDSGSQDPKIAARHRPPPSDEVVGLVEKVIGPAQCERLEHSGKLKIGLGMRIYERDRLLTESSRVHVRFKDSTYLEIGEQTSVMIDRLQLRAPSTMQLSRGENQADETKFRFLYGILRITAPEISPYKRFGVSTALAAIRVTGPSDFFVLQDVGDRDLVLKVMKGTVEVTNAVTNQTLAVPEGTGAEVRVTGQILSTGPLTPRQIEVFKARTSL